MPPASSMRDRAPPVLASGPVWALGGPRRLDAGGLRLAGCAARLLLEAGASLVCGCATGADAAVIATATATAPERLHVLCAFGPVPDPPRSPDGAPGSGRWSAPRLVRLAACAGASVQPWAGGAANLPLAVRLAERTCAVAAAATAGALVLLARDARGSLLLARRVAERGLAVVAVPLHVDRLDLPPLGAGRWVPAAPETLAHALGGVRWRPAQARLAL